MSLASAVHEGMEVHQITVTQARKTYIKNVALRKATTSSPGRKATGFRTNRPDAERPEMRKCKMEAMQRYMKPDEWEQLTRYPNGVFRKLIKTSLAKRN